MNEPRTKTDFVAAELRQMIASGGFPAGTKLRQNDIAERFAVSTTPVREAFASLAREGFVRQDAHRGVEVFRPSVAEIRENYEIRLALEPLATELAAPLITADALGHAGTLLDDLEGVPRLPLATEINRDFHLTIYRSAQRPMLLELIARLRLSADACVQLLVAHATDEYRDDVNGEHREILEALHCRSAVRAGRAMAEHLRNNLTEVVRLIPDDGSVPRPT